MFDSGSEEQNLQQKAQLFLSGVMDYYAGTNVNKLDRAEEFLDSLLFKYSVLTSNPFSTGPQETYDLAYIARYVLIPTIRKRMENKENSNPFSINDWN